MKSAVITGNPVDGFILYGPFDSGPQVAKWAEENLKEEDWWVIGLELQEVN